ncbi:MAG: putative signal transducing protein [Actinomycetota bacterium]
MRDEAPPGWRVIERAGNDIDARLIAGHLEEAGIKVVFEKDKSGYGDYLYGGGNPNAPVSLLVPDDQWEAATAVLDGASVDLTAGTAAVGKNEARDDSDDDEGAVARTDEDPFYVRDRRSDDPVLAAPARSGLRWFLIALIILIVVIAASESGFFSDLIGV